jgi:hypothetical protein
MTRSGKRAYAKPTASSPTRKLISGMIIRRKRRNRLGGGGGFNRFCNNVIEAVQKVICAYFQQLFTPNPKG